MRNQSIQLIELANELSEYVSSLVFNEELITLEISKDVKIHYNPNSGSRYVSVEFNPYPNPVAVILFNRGDFNNNTVTINVERVSDEDLDGIVLRAKKDIAIFMYSKFDKKDAVHTSSSSI